MIINKTFNSLYDKILSFYKVTVNTIVKSYWQTIKGQNYNQILSKKHIKDLSKYRILTFAFFKMGFSDNYN